MGQRIAIKVRKQVTNVNSNQLEIAICNYVRSYNAPAYIQLLAQTRSQIHVQIKHSLAHLQDLIPTLALAGIKYEVYIYPVTD